MPSSVILISVVKEWVSLFNPQSHATKMELKVPIHHVMLSKFVNNQNTSEQLLKKCSVYSQGVITDCQIWNWFSKFYASKMSLKDEHRPGYSSDFNQDDFRELMECNLGKSTQEVTLDLITF